MRERDSRDVSPSDHPPADADGGHRHDRGAGHRSRRGVRRPGRHGQRRDGGHGDRGPAGRRRRHHHGARLPERRGGRQRHGAHRRQAYAIPITTALAIAEQIVDGVDNATVHQGRPAFLGVSLQSVGTGGATVNGVVPTGPADAAGLAAGDVLTAVGGTTIATADDVRTALAGYSPGDPVTVTWTDTTGQSRTATITLATGPAD